MLLLPMRGCHEIGILGILFLWENKVIATRSRHTLMGVCMYINRNLGSGIIPAVRLRSVLGRMF